MSRIHNIDKLCLHFTIEKQRLITNAKQNRSITYSQENSCYKQSFSFSTYITFPVSCTMGDNNILGTGWLNSPTGVENPTGFGSVYERSELFTKQNITLIICTLINANFYRIYNTKYNQKQFSSYRRQGIPYLFVKDVKVQPHSHKN